MLSMTRHRQFQTTVKGQRHRAEAIDRIVDERKVVGVFDPIPLGIVAGDDGTWLQMRSDQLQRRSRHRDPDIDEHEVYRSIDLFECFAQITFAQLYEWAEVRCLEVDAGGGSL